MQRYHLWISLACSVWKGNCVNNRVVPHCVSRSKKQEKVFFRIIKNNNAQALSNQMLVTWRKVVFVPTILVIREKPRKIVCTRICYGLSQWIWKIWMFEGSRLSWFGFCCIVFSFFLYSFSVLFYWLKSTALKCVDYRMCTLAQHVIVTVSFLVRHLYGMELAF